VILLHLLLGTAVVVLCAAAGLASLRRDGAEPAVARWALGTLALQVASGMFLLTGAARVSLVHVLVPSAGLAAVVVARSVEGPGSRLAGAAYLAAAAAAVAAFVTGLGA